MINQDEAERIAREFNELAARVTQGAEDPAAALSAVLGTVILNFLPPHMRSECIGIARELRDRQRRAGQADNTILFSAAFLLAGLSGAEIADRAAKVSKPEWVH